MSEQYNLLGGMSPYAESKRSVTWLYVESAPTTANEVINYIDYLIGTVQDDLDGDRYSVVTVDGEYGNITADDSIPSFIYVAGGDIRGIAGLSQSYVQMHGGHIATLDLTNGSAYMLAGSVGDVTLSGSSYYITSHRHVTDSVLAYGSSLVNVNGGYVSGIVARDMARVYLASSGGAGTIELYDSARASLNTVGGVVYANDNSLIAIGSSAGSGGIIHLRDEAFVSGGNYYGSGYKLDEMWMWANTDRGSGAFVDSFYALNSETTAIVLEDASLLREYKITSRGAYTDAILSVYDGDGQNASKIGDVTAFGVLYRDGLYYNLIANYRASSIYDDSLRLLVDNNYWADWDLGYGGVTLRIASVVANDVDYQIGDADRFDSSYSVVFHSGNYGNITTTNDGLTNYVRIMGGHIADIDAQAHAFTYMTGGEIAVYNAHSGSTIMASGSDWKISTLNCYSGAWVTLIDGYVDSANVYDNINLNLGSAYIDDVSIYGSSKVILSPFGGPTAGRVEHIGLYDTATLDISGTIDRVDAYMSSTVNLSYSQSIGDLHIRDHAKITGSIYSDVRNIWLWVSADRGEGEIFFATNTISLKNIGVSIVLEDPTHEGRYLITNRNNNPGTISVNIYGGDDEASSLLGEIDFTASFGAEMGMFTHNGYTYILDYRDYYGWLRNKFSVNSPNRCH